MTTIVREKRIIQSIAIVLPKVVLTYMTKRCHKEGKPVLLNEKTAIKNSYFTTIFAPNLLIINQQLMLHVKFHKQLFFDLIEKKSFITSNCNITEIFPL